MKPLSEENLRYLSEQKFETEKSNKFTPKVLRDKMIEKFGSLENKDQRILVVESFEFCEDFKNLGFKNISFMSDNVDKNKFVEGIYGFETFLLNLKETKNIKFEMKFDKVIMNPPYGKLHLPILKKCVEEFVDIENGGEIVSLQPCYWLTSKASNFTNSFTKKYENIILPVIKEIELIKEKYFEAAIGTEIGIFMINKNGGFTKPTDTILEKVLSHKMTIKTVTEKNKIDGYRAIIVYNFGRSNYKGKIRYCVHYANNGYGKNNLWWTEERRKNKFSLPEGSLIPYSIKFVSEAELNNFIKCTETKFWKYLILNLQYSMSVPNKYLPFMEDYTEPWTDERFYEYFKLTPEEIKTIEDTIK